MRLIGFLRATAVVALATALAGCQAGADFGFDGPRAFLSRDRAVKPVARTDSAVAAPDKRVAIRTDDKGLAAATRRARRSMGAFLARLKADSSVRGLVKVALTLKNGAVVQAWMSVERVESGVLYGALANSGKPGDGYRVGDAHKVAANSVTDWMVLEAPYESGAIHGAFTLRVLAKRTPGLVSAAYLKRLRPLP